MTIKDTLIPPVIKDIKLAPDGYTRLQRLRERVKNLLYPWTVAEKCRWWFLHKRL
jgi:hypothetical protein